MSPAFKTQIREVCESVYGVGLAGACPTTLLWAADRVADAEGVDSAKAELKKVNAWRNRQGLTLAYPAYGDRSF